MLIAPQSPSTFDWDPAPKKQAEAVYTIFMSNSPEGCNAPTCKMTNCGEPHMNIGQFEAVMEHHRFCRGHWMADTPYYLEGAEAAGGMNRMKAACNEAQKESEKELRELQSTGDAEKDAKADKVRAETDKLTAYVHQQIGSIWVADLADTMTTMLVTTMNGQGINTLKDAADVIGKGDVSKAAEIVAMSGVDLEPQLLKEWMENAGSLMSAVNANKAVASRATAATSTARVASQRR